MSRPVDFADVRRRVTEFGERATVVSVTADGKPHVVTAAIELRDERLLTRVGSRTHANLTARPHLTLTWQPVPGGEYLLLLDGFAETIGEPNADGVSEITIRVDSGILHRLAELPVPGPSCIEL